MKTQFQGGASPLILQQNYGSFQSSMEIGTVFPQQTVRNVSQAAGSHGVLHQRHMKATVHTVVLSLAMILLSCNSADRMDQIIPKDDDTFALQFIALLQQNRIDSARHFLRSDFPERELYRLKSIADYTSHKSVRSIKHVGCNIQARPEGRQSSITYEYEFTDAWAIIGVVVDGRTTPTSIAYVFLDPLSRSSEEMNAFHWEQQGRLPKLFFIVTIMMLIVTLTALTLCIRTPMQHKWAWILSIIIGIGNVSMNWTYGTVHLQIVSIQLLSVGLIKAGPYAPWILSCSLPVGAMVFLVRYFRSRNDEDPQDDTERTR